MDKIFYKLDVRTNEADYELMAAYLTQVATGGWSEQSLPTGETVFTIYCHEADWIENLKQRLAARFRNSEFGLGQYIQGDWLENWKEFFKPVFCGSRFVVLPPWLAEMEARDRQKIIIEPKSAFGTGQHASTALCLTALSQLLEKGSVGPGQSFLDLGCGTGILGIGAAKAGLYGFGLDIDELSISNALENLALNDIAAMKVARGSVEDAPDEKFDLIMANILAQPLMEMAKEIAGRLKPQGKLVLSGLLDVQAEQVTRAYTEQGLPRPLVLADGEWRALVFEL